MPDAVELRILGPLELSCDGVPVPLAGVKPQQLLATLALHHDCTVSVDHLVDVLWPHGPPRSARANVHTYVSGLRALLGEERLCRQPPGYRLRLSAAEFDAARFEQCTGAAQPSLEVLDGALALWRGTPVGNLPQSPRWSAELGRLEERRRALRRVRGQLRIERGEAEDALPDLRALVDEDPLHEEAWLLLLTALRATGRRAEALTAYANARRVFVQELGIEPGEALDRLHRTLLADQRPQLWTVARDAGQLDADGALIVRGLARLDLGPTPGWVAAALLDRPAAAVLDTLERARLLRRTGVDAAGQERFALPVLIGLLAPDLPDPDASGAATDAALTRVLAGYLARAERSALPLPSQAFGPVEMVAPRWHEPDAGTADLAAPGKDPVAWFEAERDALLGAVDLAARTHRAALAWEVAHALMPWCDLGGHTAEWERTHRSALSACRDAGDLLGEAMTLRGLGLLQLYRDDYGPAAEAFSRSRLLFARLGNDGGVAGALSGLGAVHRALGELDAAQSCFEQALTSNVEAGYRHGEAYAFGALGLVQLDRGRFAEASDSLRTGLAIAAEVDDGHRIAHLTHRLGIVRLRAGEHAEARSLFVSALDRFSSIGDAHGKAYCLADLAALEPTGAALDRLTDALETFERIGDRRAQAETARRLGELHRDAGRTGLSDAYLAESRRLRSTVEPRTAP